MIEGYKTFLGLVVTLIATIFKDYTNQTETEAALTAGIQLVGIAIAIYGRYKAKKVF
jgi:hypothetical protein